jgi:hypothetical protein
MNWTMNCFCSLLLNPLDLRRTLAAFLPAALGVLLWVGADRSVGAAEVGVSAPTSAGGHRTDWFRDARYGVFMHFLPGDDRGLGLVKAFDVDALAGQLADLGAGYFVITLGQNSGYFNSPNATYDRIAGYAAGERCSTRDLPLDLWRALRPYGIRLMLYLPCQVPNGDTRAQKAFGLDQGPKDQPLDVAFAQKWGQVIQEWSDRYGDRVAGFVTLDLGPNWDPEAGPIGGLAEGQRVQVRAIRDAVKQVQRPR